MLTCLSCQWAFVKLSYANYGKANYHTLNPSIMCNLSLAMVPSQIPHLLLWNKGATLLSLFVFTIVDNVTMMSKYVSHK